VKATGPAAVRIDMRKLFLVNTDTFGGNSGSAVFNARTHLVEGIYVRNANDDYELENGCYVAAVYPSGLSDAKEWVSNISQVLPYLETGAAQSPETIPAVVAPVAPQDGMASKVHF
jgi:hypothetical protein